MMIRMICTDSIIRKNNWHMKQKENEKNNLNEMGVTIGVDNEVIEKVRSGEITHIIVEINEDNQNMFLENIDGNLVLL